MHSIFHPSTIKSSHFLVCNSCMYVYVWLPITPGEVHSDIRKISSLKALSSTGKGCPGKQLSHDLWRNLKGVQALCLGTWCSGGLGSVRFMFEFDDLNGLLQGKSFYDSVTLCITIQSQHLIFTNSHSNKQYRSVHCCPDISAAIAIVQCSLLGACAKLRF